MQFKDERESTASLKKFQEMANTSEGVTKTGAIQKKANTTGLPDNLKSGAEQLSGISLDDVSVKYNSQKPAQLQAHAFAKGNEIHIGPGQEKHLPHETWHVVQQKQGRVQPTHQMKQGVNINDDAQLEKEADIMGTKALQMKGKPESSLDKGSGSKGVHQLITTGAFLGIGSGNIALVKQIFGKDTDVIVKNAKSVEQLKQWTVKMRTLKNQLALAKKNAIDSPSMNQKQQQTDMLVYKNAQSEVEKTLQEYLTSTSEESAPKWGVSTGTPKAGPSTAVTKEKETETKEDSEPKVPDTLPEFKGFLKDSYHGHGSFFKLGNKSSKATIARKQLRNHIIGSRGHFDYQNEQQGGYSYVLNLGMDEKGKKNWFITVIYYPKSEKVKITHFGPFGDTTSNQIEDQTY